MQTIDQPLRRRPLVTVGRFADVCWLLAAATAAVVVGYLARDHTTFAALIALSPFVAVALAQPHLTLLCGVATLPFLAISAQLAGAQVTASDLLFALSTAGVLAAAALDETWRARLAQLRPALVFVSPFAVWLLVVLAVHPSTTVAVNTVQTFQLILVPLVLGAVVVGPRQGRLLLRVYVVASVLLALVWIGGGDSGFGIAGNKNPAGQFIANAAVLVFGLAPSWRWRLLLVPLGAGLIFTQSRGALLGAAAGIVIFIILRGMGSWRRTVAAIVPLVALVAVGYTALPDDVVSRSTDFSVGDSSAAAGGLSAAEYSAQLREVFLADGLALINANPVFGVGPGNYITGDVSDGTATIDPHNLAVRTAGDLGYPGLAAFILLVAGTLVLAIRRRRVNPFAVAAVAVQVSVLVHGLVDVYWVRGTPVLPWLLLGLALNRSVDARRP